MNAQPLLKVRPSGLSFKSVEMRDRAELGGFLARYPRTISGFTFAALYAWNTDAYEWTRCGDGALLISCEFPGENQRHYLQPVGVLDTECQKAFLDEIQNAGYPVKIFSVSDEFLKAYPEFCSRFSVENDMALANYVYRARDLAELHGKQYAKKRNLIAQASALYKWSAVPLTAQHRQDCLAILNKAEITHDGEQRWLHEKAAAMTAIADFSALGQKGVLILIDGKPAAFSIYEEMTPDMAVVHFEKADRGFKGLYQIINQETAKAIASAGYSLINREEDLGIEGLRQAKHSYGPVEVVASYTLTSA